MTKEEKELLIKDLCGRLSYEVKGIITYNGDKDIFTVKGIHKDNLLLSECEACKIEDFKSYLRPLSNITEEEYNELKKISSYYGLAPFEDIHNWTPNYNLIDWLNRKMFDYRGLIPMGFAIEAPKGMYIN